MFFFLSYEYIRTRLVSLRTKSKRKLHEGLVTQDLEYYIYVTYNPLVYIRTKTRDL
jgi:hypothetical protein